ncbi:MAG: extracellular solute-binding protein [Deltaproteobacteria bacterium]|nr:extracellular solute-binding protein [Deltaproteobacteria bacterium]
MNRLYLLASCAILAWKSFFPGMAAAAELREMAEAEGRVVFYATMNTSDAKALTDGFKQVYPKIDAQFFRSVDAQMMEKILTEARAGRPLWDVVSVTSFYGHVLKKRGMLAPYDSAERKYYREGYKDPQGMWTSTYTNYAVFGYNTGLVPRASVPRSHTDLLKPEWKGQIGLEGRAYEWFATVVSRMGEEKGLKFMRSLAQQQAQTRTGRTLIAQLVAAGEFRGALTAYSQNYENLKLTSAPVEWVALDPVFANIHPTGLAAKAPHPNAGRLFIDFILSKRGQEIIRALKRIPDRIDTLPDPPRLVEGIKPAFARPEVFDDFDRYVKLFKEVFGGK